MASFLTVNFNSTFYAEALLSSLPPEWICENEIIIVDNSNNLEPIPGVKIIQGTGKTHARGLLQGLKECRENAVIISDIDCLVMDPTLLQILSNKIDSGVAMIQCAGSAFKPLRPCFGALNREVFLREGLSFTSKGLQLPPKNWISYFGDPSNLKPCQDRGGMIYLDVAVASGYELLERGYKVERIPQLHPPDSFANYNKCPDLNGWWFGYKEPQVWHIVYGASQNRFIIKGETSQGVDREELWGQKEALVTWVLQQIKEKR